MTTLLNTMVSSCRGQYLLIVFSLLMIIECRSLKLLELRVPAHVVLGARAQLSCRWALGPADVLYSVKWYKDGKEFFRYVPQDYVPLKKFPLPGVHVEESDSSGSRLVLAGAGSETAGRYRCEVSGERPLFPTVSEHADMDVVVLPDHGPVITGLRSRYRHGDRLQVNCTSGRSQPACELSWYINGEPAQPPADLPPIHQVYGDGLEITTLLLDFNLTEQHFSKSYLKIKCLATLASLYWQSNEESAVLEKVKIHERLLLSVRDTNSRPDRVHTNLAWLQKSSFMNVVGALFAILYNIYKSN